MYVSFPLLFGAWVQEQPWLSRSARAPWLELMTRIDEVVVIGGNAGPLRGSAQYSRQLRAVRGFVEEEMSNVESTRSQLQEFGASFEKVEAQAKTQTSSAHDEMNEVLEEIKVLREDVKEKVGEGLNGLSAAAGRISKEVIGEFAEFHSELHSSYSVLGKDLKAMFEDMTSHLDQQKAEINRLRLELQEATRQTVEANRKASSNLAHVLEEEHATAQAERDTLISQIRTMLDESSQRQSNRLKGKFDTVRTDLSASGDSLEHATAQYDRSVDEWIFKEEQFAKDVTASRDDIKTKMQNDWEVSLTVIQTI